MLEISKREIISRLKAVDNPWWDERPVPEEWMYADLPHRAYFNAFRSLCCESGVRRAPVLMGPRRVGKTVMLHQTIHRMIQDGWNPRHILFASVDTPLYTGLPLEAFVNILIELHDIDRSTPFAVFFDEIQYLKDWEVHLKSLVDSYPKARFVASGSAAAALRVKSRESGAGRFSDFMLPPLTFAEYLAFIGREEELIGKDAAMSPFQLAYIDQLNEEFVNYVNYGGYPEAVVSQDVRRDASQFIRRDIVDKALLRDIPSLYGINDVQELYRLFTAVAYNTGQEFTLDGLSKASGVKKDTLRKYLYYLEAAFLIIKVRRVDETGKTFKRERGFKLYLTNPSLRAALFQPIGADDEAMGHLAETAFFSQWFHMNEMNVLRYARWRGGEVDFIKMDPVTLRPEGIVEVKWTDRFFNHPEQLRALLAFAEKTALPNAVATTRTVSGFTPMDSTAIVHIPCSYYAYWIGKHGIQKKVTEILDSIKELK